MFLISLVWIEIIVLVIILGVSGFFITFFSIRNLRKKKYAILKCQAKFDIELRKAFNLIQKNNYCDELKPYEDKVIKDLSLMEKRELLDIIEKVMESVEKTATNDYVFEIYSRLEEERLFYDSRVLKYNEDISHFPYNLFRKALGYEYLETITKKL